MKKLLIVFMLCLFCSLVYCEDVDIPTRVTRDFNGKQEIVEGDKIVILYNPVISGGGAVYTIQKSTQLLVNKTVPTSWQGKVSWALIFDLFK